MSTPNTSLVKWVEPYELYSGDSVDVNRVPVIALSDLTELVEGRNGLDTKGGNVTLVTSKPITTPGQGLYIVESLAHYKGVSQ